MRNGSPPPDDPPREPASLTKPPVRHQLRATQQRVVAPAQQRAVPRYDRAVPEQPCQALHLVLVAAAPAVHPPQREPHARVLERARDIHADVTAENTANGAVDTSRVTLVLPQDLIERLGFRQHSAAFVTHGDGRREQQPPAGPVTVPIGNRPTVLDCVVNSPASHVLIGYVVLAVLDLLADCSNKTLTLQYPDYPAIR